MATPRAQAFCKLQELIDEAAQSLDNEPIAGMPVSIGALNPDNQLLQLLIAEVADELSFDRWDGQCREHAELFFLSFTDHLVASGHLKLDDRPIVTTRAISSTASTPEAIPLQQQALSQQDSGQGQPCEEAPWERAMRMYEDDEIDIDPLDPNTMPPRIEFGRDYWEALGTTAWCHRDRKEGKDLQRSLDKAWPLIPRDELPRDGEPFDKLYFRLSEEDLHELNFTTQQLEAEIAEQLEKHRTEISSLDQKLRDSWNNRPTELRNIPAFDLMDTNFWLLRAMAYPQIAAARGKGQERSKATQDMLDAEKKAHIPE